MNYIGALHYETYSYIVSAFSEMFEHGDAHWVNKDEFLDMLLGCQAGQSLAHEAITQADECNMDVDSFVKVQPRHRLEAGANDCTLSIYADRSVRHSARNYPAQIYLDIDDLVANRPDLFGGTDGTLPNPFSDLRFVLPHLPHRFWKKIDSEYLTADNVRDMLICGEYKHCQVFNNRLLMQPNEEDSYIDIGAVPSQMFVEEIHSITYRHYSGESETQML